MTSITGLFACPLFYLYSSSDARLCGTVWLDILGVIYLCVETAWATFKI